MQKALFWARKAAEKGEVPVGALIVKDKKIIATGQNEVERRNDATAHAEFLAIKAACQKLKRRYLDEMTLYVTLEPCPLCAGAILLSRIGRVVYGAFDLRMGAMETVFAISQHPHLHRPIELRGGVCEDQCRAILREFFHPRR